jgi:hypothetical protein
MAIDVIDHPVHAPVVFSLVAACGDHARGGQRPR